ncbi:MAG: hypothetical protein SGILL_001729 [Bacillariaceae sp.]
MHATNTTTTNAADADSVAAASETSSVFTEGELVMGLYFPPSHDSADSNDNNANNSAIPPIWWPAKTYSSVNAFCDAFQEQLDVELSDLVRSGKLSKKSKKEIQTKLTGHAVVETSRQNNVHTLYYLSRPLHEYQMAKKNGPVEVVEVLKNIAKTSKKYMYQPQHFGGKQQIYLDFHKAYQLAMTEMLGEDYDASSDQDMLETAQRAWNEYKERQEEQAIIPAAAAAAPQEQQQFHEHHHQEPILQHHHHQDQHLGSPMGHSVAAVSCTEESLVSYNTRDTHTPARSSSDRYHEERSSTATKQSHLPESIPLPEKLSSPIPPKATFDALWHQFQMEGWDVYQNGESGELVYRATNGYTFESQADFHRYLHQEYDWQPPTGKTRRQLDVEQRAQMDRDEKRRSLLWDYLKRVLGWSFNFKSQRETLGTDGAYVYFRPSFDIRNRGVQGQDHFTSLKELEEYCIANSIQAPPTPGSESAEDDNAASKRPSRKAGKRSDEDDDDRMDPSHDEDDEEEEEAPASPEEDGYETPTDQAPTPQDPGKPLERDDSENESVESEEDDETRYEFSRLWKKLKVAGWYWKRGPSELDNWWYYKPVRSIRFDEEDGERKLREGLDYFTSPDDVIAYIKGRDATLNGSKKKKAKKSDKSEHPAKKSKSGKQAAAQETKRSATTNLAGPSPNKTSKGKKRGRDAKGNLAEKTAKKSRGECRKSPGETCADDGLTVESSTNQAPWAKRAPLFEHRVVIDPSTGVSYNGPYYYVPGESPGNFSQRFENITELVQFCAQSSKFDAAEENGESASKNSLQQEFARYLRYAFVPGNRSKWGVTRMITKSEASYLLAKAEYRKMTGEDKAEKWYPPESLVSSGKLKSSYSSMDLLCSDLRGLEDLESTVGSSRRRKQGNLTPSQTMALRLAVADGFAKEVHVATQQKEERDLESLGESEPMEIEAPKKSAAVAQKAPVAKTTSKNKKRERSPEQDRSLLSPDKIDVRYEGHENTAPWAAIPLLPAGWSWHSLFTKMGCTYKGGTYYMPGKNYKNTSDDFTRIPQLQACICEEGDYSKYLDVLDDEKEKCVARRCFNYAFVPGTEHVWKSIRSLKLREVILFLNLLGFEKDADGQWSVPSGVKNMERETYPSLSRLGEALVRVPDLEDRTKGESTRRRSTQTKRILNEKQIMALRLRIAEGLEDEGSSPHSTGPSNATKKTASTRKPPSIVHQPTPANKPSDADDVSEFGEMSRTDSCSVETVEKAKNGVVVPHEAWKYLQDLGCTHSGSTYRVPKDDKRCETQNQLVEYILSSTVSVLDWDNCTLTSEELEQLELYLRSFTAKLNSSSKTKKAMALVEEGNVPGYLRKIGVSSCEHNMYQIGDRSHKYDIAGLVNEIRCTPDLFALASADGTPSRRNKPLEDLQVLAVRLWSISVEIPLRNFPDPATFQEQQKQRKLRSPIAEVVTKPMSKVMDLEEVQIKDVRGTEERLEEHRDAPAGVGAQDPSASDEFLTPASKASESSSFQKTSSRPSPQEEALVDEAQEPVEDDLGGEDKRMDTADSSSDHDDEMGVIDASEKESQPAVESPAAESKASSHRDESQEFLGEESILDDGLDDDNASPIEYLDPGMGLDTNLLNGFSPDGALFRARNEDGLFTQPEEPFDASNGADDLIAEPEEGHLKPKGVRRLSLGRKQEGNHDEDQDPLDFVGDSLVSIGGSFASRKPKKTYGSQKKKSRANQPNDSLGENIFAVVSRGLRFKN